LAYLLDTNTFIEAKNLFYRFAVCPAFWDWIAREHGAGLLMSIDEVQIELTKGNDDLSRWAAAQTATFFLRRDTATVAAAPAVSAWAAGRPFTQAAIQDFFASADYWLIAYALAHSHTVVTRETSDPNSKKKVKIPDACLGVGVPCKSPFDLLEDEGAVFVLQ